MALPLRLLFFFPARLRCHLKLSGAFPNNYIYCFDSTFVSRLTGEDNCRRRINCRQKKNSLHIGEKDAVMGVLQWLSRVSVCVGVCGCMRKKSGCKVQAIVSPPTAAASFRANKRGDHMQTVNMRDKNLLFLCHSLFINRHTHTHTQTCIRKDEEN